MKFTNLLMIHNTGYDLKNSIVQSQLPNSIEAGKTIRYIITNFNLINGNPFILSSYNHQDLNSFYNFVLTIIKLIPDNHILTFMVKASVSAENTATGRFTNEIRSISRLFKITTHCPIPKLFNILAAHYKFQLLDQYNDIQLDHLIIEIRLSKDPFIGSVPPISQNVWPGYSLYNDGVTAVNDDEFKVEPKVKVRNHIQPLPANYAYATWYDQFPINEVLVHRFVAELNLIGQLEQISLRHRVPLFVLKNDILYYVIFRGKSMGRYHQIHIFVMNEDLYLTAYFIDKLPFPYSTRFKYLTFKARHENFNRYYVTNRTQYDINAKLNLVVLSKESIKSTLITARKSDHPKTIPGTAQVRKYSTLSRPTFTTSDISYKDRLRMLTIDIESYSDENGVHIPYACMVFDGVDTKLFYLESLNHDIIKDMLDYIFQAKYHGYTVYAHNLSRYDLNFMFTKILTYPKIEPDFTVNNEKVVIFGTCVIKNRKMDIIIDFRDSLRLLPLSLAALGSTFNVPVQKGVLDHQSINASNYMERKHEVVPYLTNDVVSLYQIMTQFYWDIYDNFKISIFNTPTISSLCWAIWRSNFYDPLATPLFKVKNEHYLYMKLAYFGGHVDVYKTYGENLYYYDVNSLYPYCMTFPLPCSEPVFVNGPGINIDEIFGIVYAEVEAPKGLNIPFLLYRNANVVYAPIGKWFGYFTTVELKFAITLGYKVRVIHGYNFKPDSANPFSNYIDYFYDLKSTTLDKSIKSVSKLLLNTLYGRTGIRPSVYKLHHFKNQHELDMLLNDTGKVIVDYDENVNYALLELDPNKSQHRLVNVAVAAFITSYARIHIYKFKTIPGNPAYYSDTDSIILQDPLPNSYVKNDMGFMKLEKVIDKGYMLGPKMYAFLLPDGSLDIKIKGMNIKHYYNSMEGKMNIFNNFKDLHDGKIDNILLRHNKMRRSEALIGYIFNEINSKYTLSVSDSKRKFIRNDKGVIISTKPYNVDEINNA